MFKKTILISIAFLLIFAGTASATDQERLGKKLFFDTNLSEPAGQGCVSCHDPAFAFTEPDKDRAVSAGIITGRFGSRNAPSAAYAAFSPELSFAVDFTGGMFWDGRAANLTEQAKGPFLNRLEMNNPNEGAVLNKIQASEYANLFDKVCGASPDRYTCMAQSIAAFEKTKEFNKFNSKFDLNPIGLTPQETRGRVLFNGKAGCSVCHPEPFFTTFGYENIGVPTNLGMTGDSPALQHYFPFYYESEFNPAGLKFKDAGLANNPNVPSILKPGARGLMKIPTLRNVELTSPYMHNGVFRDLKQVVHFYNTRDALDACANTITPQPGVNCWTSPEVPVNLNIATGNLQLTDDEENDIVAFLKTLTDLPDGFVPLPSPALTDKEQLGKNVFFDTSLSRPKGQGCVSCHDPKAAFTAPDKTRGVSEGATAGRFGNRNAPSTLYAALAPDFGFVGALFSFNGGMFWDERAQNLTEQAKGPFLNPLEMNNLNIQAVINGIKKSAYRDLFNKVCGNGDPDSQFNCVAESIAAFEKTKEMNNFTSKLDLAPAGLTIQESRGRVLFNGKGNCAVCHPEPFFTDFDSENIGVPGNLGMLGDSPALQTYFPFYYETEFNPAGLKFADKGVANNPNVPSILKTQSNGLIKAPSLRNINLTGPYMHNGVFKDLNQVVHFYNTRDTLGDCADRQSPQPGINCWPAPEVRVNLNDVVGNLGLTDAEEKDIVAFLKTLSDGFVPQPPPAPTAQEQLGKLLFFDTNLSTPPGQGCVSCHDPAAGFTEPNKARGVSQGATPGRFGSRNAPSTAYAALAPEFVFGNEAGLEFVFIGGMFWDGRAQNLTEQAKGPFLNKLEMNNTNEGEVLSKINASAYAPLFNQVCGASPDKYTCMAQSIAAFEKTKEMNKFSSKFDLEMSELKVQEMRGFALFNGKAKCAVCHISAAVAFEQPLFTDFDYENIGVPGNLGMMGDSPDLQTYFPFYYETEFNPDLLKFQDIGLAGNPNVPSIMKPMLKGLMKTPTLRNVELTAPYMHNGVFKDLPTVVHFYNTRDTLGNCANSLDPQPGVNCWPAPEVQANLNVIVGNLGLTSAEEEDIVAFLKTLTDK